MKNQKQLSLSLCLKDTEDFANFFVGRNQQLVSLLKSLNLKHGSNFVYIWGALGAGKTHLLNSLCRMFSNGSTAIAYLPFEDIDQFVPEILDDIDSLDLLCIDDINLIKDDVWEEKVFHSFNRIIDSGKKIVVTSDVAPQFLEIKLADLKSRMGGGLVFELYALDDEEKILGLQMRAKLRGLELNDNVARFLLRHYQRDTKELFMMLEKLDHAALIAQRKLTVPFVKKILNGVD